MEKELITIFVVCDDLLKTIQYEDDHQAQMSTAEVITFAIGAAKFFGGNHRSARLFFRSNRCFRHTLSLSRLCRRLHQIPWSIWTTLFQMLGFIFQRRNKSQEYAVDSFPVPFCEKQRIDRRKIFPGKGFIGFAPSKKKFFCGFKVHMIVTCDGEPIEISLRPASESDLAVFRSMRVDLPPFSTIYADGAYDCSTTRELFTEDSAIEILAKRGNPHSKRECCPEQQKKISSRRQIVETAFSCITRMFPRNILVSTERGFLIRLMSFVLAYSISCLTRACA